MTTESIREQLHQYIDKADEIRLIDLQETIEAWQEGHYEWWNDPDMISRLDKVDEQIAAGTLAGKLWADVKSELRGREQKINDNNKAA